MTLAGSVPTAPPDSQTPQLRSGMGRRQRMVVKKFRRNIMPYHGICLLVAPPRSPAFADILVTLFRAEFEYVQENREVRG
jgi:hypothetical protein